MPFYEVMLSGKWEAYDSRIGKAMADAKQRGAKEFQFEMRGKPYKVDFIKMLQIAPAGGKSRPIRDKHAWRPKHYKKEHGGPPPTIELRPDPGMRIVTVPMPKGGWPRPGSKVSFTVDSTQYFLEVSEETLKQKFVKIQVPEVTDITKLKDHIAEKEKEPAPPAPAAPEKGKKGFEPVAFAQAMAAGLFTGALAVGGLVAVGEIEVDDLKDLGMDALAAGEELALDAGEALVEGADAGGALVIDAADDVAAALDGLM